MRNPGDERWTPDVITEFADGLLESLAGEEIPSPVASWRRSMGRQATLGMMTFAAGRPLSFQLILHNNSYTNRVGLLAGTSYDDEQLLLEVGTVVNPKSLMVLEGQPAKLAAEGLIRIASQMPTQSPGRVAAISDVDVLANTWSIEANEADAQAEDGCPFTLALKYAFDSANNTEVDGWCVDLSADYGVELLSSDETTIVKLYDDPRAFECDRPEIGVMSIMSKTLDLADQVITVRANSLSPVVSDLIVVRLDPSRSVPALNDLEYRVFQISLVDDNYSDDGNALKVISWHEISDEDALVAIVSVYGMLSLTDEDQGMQYMDIDDDNDEGEF